jgi:hypothetical protein
MSSSSGGRLVAPADQGVPKLLVLLDRDLAARQPALQDVERSAGRGSHTKRGHTFVDNLGHTCKSRARLG